MAIKLTATQLLLLELLISNAIRAALNEYANLTEEEVQERISQEQTRKAELLKRLNAQEEVE